MSVERTVEIVPAQSMIAVTSLADAESVLEELERILTTLEGELEA